MNHKLIYILSVAIFVGVGCAVPIKKTATPAPTTSHEAFLIETSSPHEMLVSATGMGKNSTEAINSARRSAVNFIIFGGISPLLQTQKEKIRFQSIENNFFTTENVRKYIIWESLDVKSRVRSEKTLRITKHFKVDRSRIEAELTNSRIILSRDRLAQEIGSPFIMVIPETSHNKNPIELLSSDANLKSAATQIEAYLTDRSYEVQVPMQNLQIHDLAMTTATIENFTTPDLVHQLALNQIGSDIYITYGVDFGERQIAGTTVRKAIVRLSAYETSTARLLASETGYSHERQTSSLAVLIGEAINNSIDGLLSRIDRHWKNDVVRGTQYRLIFTISDRFNHEESVKISFLLHEIIAEITDRFKEISATAKTLDYLIWAKRDSFATARALYGEIRSIFPKKFRAGKVTLRSINRKLILVEITKSP